MIKGFKEFILRGNVVDLAVAVVIGAAFTAVINAVVAAVINPLISLFFDAKNLDDVGPWVPGLQGQLVFFPLGTLVGAIISFLAVALVVYFVLVFPMNKFKERAAAKAGITDEAAAPTEAELLTQIRDLLQKQQSA